MNIARNLERSQALFPHKAAILFEGNSLTYQELNSLSNRIANGLAEYGVGIGDRVALFLPNIPAFMGSYFAVQKLGAVAVTLNSSLKVQETSFILNDCQAKFIITTAALRSQLNSAALPSVKQIFIAEGAAPGDTLLSDLVAQASPSALAVDRECDDPAVIIYTSGTTGFPKGATLSQGNIVSNVRTTTYTLRLQADDRIMLCLPAFHNYGQYATFNPCVDAGATLILHREFEPETILRSIVNDKVSTFFGVPTLYTLLMDKASPEQLASLKRCISAGAPLPLELSNQWQDKFALAINQIYGLTECSMACFNHFFKHQPGSIGTPVEGTELKIANDLGQAVPTGELGEIAVRGPGVMLGYWNQPEATALAIKDGWFHTGDIGRLDEAGYVYIVDRLKDMVNVGGEKVYTSEVEQVLHQHPAVAEVAVYGVTEPLMGEQVRAAIILKKGQETTAEALLEFCRQALADYKVPSVFKFVDALPKGRTGKVLKRLLRDGAQPSSIDSKLAAAKTVTEQRAWLSQWLVENLSLEQPVALDKPFNEYGLTSLLAVKLVSELNDWLGSACAPVIVWNYPTINRLAAYLSQAGDVRKDAARMELWPAIDPYHVYDPLMYQRMVNDTVRTEIYRLAIGQTVANKIVLEIGPGQEANLTRLCVEAGAKHVYAVELDGTACQKAQTLVNKLGLADKITLIHGDATQINLPELAEACVSGLAGQIGGSEGVVALINQTRRLLAEDAIIIPQRYVSKIAAVSIPELVAQFTPLGWQYTDKIFDQVGHPFDLRVIINRFETSCILSDNAVFEEIDFSQQPEGQGYPTGYQHDIRLTVTRDGRLDGFIIWLNLHTVKGVMMDVLEKGDLWLPTYFPVFYPGLPVSVGDVIEATCIGCLSDNHINPDYRLKGQLIRIQGSPVEFDHHAPHHGKQYQHSLFYRELFKGRPCSSAVAGEQQITRDGDIAIIGLGCRFPGGADSPEKFWDILKNGVDTVSEISPDRWDRDAHYDAHPGTPGKMYLRSGSFLPNVDTFDAAFFGILPLEARSLDPQQRLLLEVCWEALENAGYAPHELRHSQTGMFVGSFWDDYSALNLYKDDPKQIDGYRLTSSLRGMGAGRLSYVFQFHGPSMQVDTACSSSLLAIHLACQSLRADECHLAVAGGVTLFLSPEVMVGLCCTNAVAPDGRTKAFAADADGFGVGEGAGMVVLKRLSDAKRDGDTILAVIKGSAVNHDGPSNGLTAPNGLAQQALLRQALHNADLKADQIDYIEAHGTGTSLGDPIEAEALTQVFKEGRTHPLLLGSVKTNIGHLSAAAWLR
jgi:long-chain acyl-CoA synthetase